MRIIVQSTSKNFAMASGGWALCLYTIEANVAIVPGSAFGVPDCVRFSFAAKDDDLIGGIEALGSWCLR